MNTRRNGSSGYEQSRNNPERKRRLDQGIDALELGQRICDFRENDLQLTQSMLAEKIGCHVHIIQLLEEGQWEHEVPEDLIDGVVSSIKEYAKQKLHVTVIDF